MRDHSPFAAGWRYLAIVGACALVLAMSCSARAQQTPPTAASAVELRPLAEDVYLFRVDTYQAIFIVTPEGVIATDPIGLRDPTAPEQYRAAIASVTPLPVRFVIYGHDHQDHIAGGIVFADTAQFVSQRLAAPRIASRADPQTPVPTLLFDDHLRLELGGTVVELHYPGRAHSDNDLVLVYPARRLAYVTDVIEPNALPAMRFSSPPEYLSALRWIESRLDFDVLVAGHGPLGNMDTVRQLRSFIEDLTAAVLAARAQGLEDNSEAMVASVRAALTPRYGHWEGIDRRLAGSISAVIPHLPGS